MLQQCMALKPDKKAYTIMVGFYYPLIRIFTMHPIFTGDRVQY